jgi:hypothetical protein
MDHVECPNAACGREVGVIDGVTQLECGHCGRTFNVTAHSATPDLPAWKTAPTKPPHPDGPRISRTDLYGIFTKHSRIEDLKDALGAATGWWILLFIAASALALGTNMQIGAAAMIAAVVAHPILWLRGYARRRGEIWRAYQTYKVAAYGLTIREIRKAVAALNHAPDSNPRVWAVFNYAGAAFLAASVFLTLIDPYMGPGQHIDITYPPEIVLSLALMLAGGALLALNGNRLWNYRANFIAYTLGSIIRVSMVGALLGVSGVAGWFAGSLVTDALSNEVGFIAGIIAGLVVAFVTFILIAKSLPEKPLARAVSWMAPTSSDAERRDRRRPILFIRTRRTATRRWRSTTAFIR